MLVALASGRWSARVYAVPGPRGAPCRRWYAAVAHLTSALVLITVVVGILVTGSGPHAGDGGAARNGLDPEFMQHVHSWPAYALFALTLVLVIGARRTPPAAAPAAVDRSPAGRRGRCRSSSGLWQARAGLPIVLVNIHMVLAVLLVAAMTAVVMHLKAPAGIVQEGPAYAGSVESASALR